MAPTFLVCLLLMAVSLWATFKVKSTFAHYQKVNLRSGVSGAEAAQAILRAAGIRDVEIAAVPGLLSDHYDPGRKVVALSPEVLEGRNAAAVAVAAHEVGHALQHADAYAPLTLRSQMAPLVGFANALAIPMLIFGFVTHSLGLAWLGVAGFAAAVLFHVVTLPVEFDASRRAIAILERSGLVAPDEMHGVRRTLYAAGFTYLAAALLGVAELVHWLSVLGLFGGDRE